jgi:hypothetical protein
MGISLCTITQTLARHLLRLTVKTQTRRTLDRSTKALLHRLLLLTSNSNSNSTLNNLKLTRSRNGV